MLVVAFFGRLDLLILMVGSELFVRVHGVFYLLEMVPVDAYCLKGSLLAAVWAQDIIILSGELNI